MSSTDARATDWAEARTAPEEEYHQVLHSASAECVEVPRKEELLIEQ